MKTALLRLPVLILAGFLLRAIPASALQTDALESVPGFEPSRVTVSLNGFSSSFFKVDNVNYSRLNDNFYGLNTQLNVMISPSPYWAFYGRINANILDRRAHTIDRLNPYFYNQLDSSPEFAAWIGQAYLKINLSGHELRLGRIGTEYDAWGLAGLGWAPATAFTRVAPFDNGYAHDGVHWNYGFGNGFSLHALAGRAVTGENMRAYYGGRSDLKWYEGRYGVVQIEGRKLWPNGGVSLALRYERDATDQWLPGQAAGIVRVISINPAFRYSFGKLSLQTEARLAWAKEATMHDELRGMAFGAFANLAYDLGRGDLNLSGWFFSGNSIGDANSVSRAEIGFDFYPLLIAYNSGTGFRFLDTPQYGFSLIELANNGSAHIGSPQWFGLWQSIDNKQNNHWAIALSGNYQILDNLCFTATLAYLHLIHANYRGADRAMWENFQWNILTYVEQAKALGLELNIGLSYDILPCLNLSTMGGYLWSGKALRVLEYETLDRDGSGDLSNGDEIQAVWQDPQNYFAWYTSLTWRF